MDKGCKIGRSAPKGERGGIKSHTCRTNTALPAPIPPATRHNSSTRQESMGRETLRRTGNEQSCYTSITRGGRPVNANESSDARPSGCNLRLVKTVISSHADSTSFHPITSTPRQLPNIATCATTTTHRDIDLPRKMKHCNICESEGVTLRVSPKNHERKHGD